MTVRIVPMTIADHDEVLRLWQGAEGVGLHEYEDSREGIARYLERNPGMSFVARDGSELAGAVLCGHDGRTGTIFHLAVAPEYRRQSIGSQLVDHCLAGLREAGIRRCGIIVFKNNESGRAFWKKLGWTEREDLIRMGIETGVEG